MCWKMPWGCKKTVVFFIMIMVWEQIYACIAIRSIKAQRRWKVWHYCEYQPDTHHIIYTADWWMFPCRANLKNKQILWWTWERNKQLSSVIFIRSLAFQRANCYSTIKKYAEIGYRSVVWSFVFLFSCSLLTAIVLMFKRSVLHSLSFIFLHGNKNNELK